MEYITLANGKQVPWNEFSKWGAQRQMMSLLPPNKGRKFGEDFGKKISLIRRDGFKNGIYKCVDGASHTHARGVKTPDGVFGTIKEAGIFYSVRGATIRSWIKNGKDGFMFITPPKIRNKPIKKGGVSGALNKSSRAVVTPEGRFSSLKDAARHLGISTGALAWRIKHSINEEYRYETERENRKIGISPNRKKVMTPDGIFESIADAARYYGITGEGIRYRLKSNSHAEFRLIESDIKPTQPPA